MNARTFIMSRCLVALLVTLVSFLTFSASEKIYAAKDIPENKETVPSSISSSNIKSLAAKIYPKVTVTLHGLNKTESESILLNLSIKLAEKEKKIDDHRIESLHHIAPQEIARTLESLGYYHSQIQSKLTQVAGGYHAEYWVTLSRATYVRSVTIEIMGEGKDHPKLKARAAHPTLKQGSILLHSVYEQDKQALLSEALQLGFLDAAFEKNEIRVHQDSYSADVILILNTGKQYRLGPVVFKNPPYSDHYLSRYISFQPGAPYTTESINQFQKNLTDTDMFKYIRIDPEWEEEEDGVIPLKVKLKPRPHNRFFGGGGYGTDSGPRGMVGWERRRKHFPGHKINTLIKASQRFNQFNLRYSIPGRHPATDRLVFGLRLTEETTRDKKYSRRGDLSVTRIKKIGDFETLLDLNYLDEVFRELQGTPKEQSHFLIPSMGFVWTNVQETCPKQLGIQIGTTFRGAARPILSSISFVQGDFRFKWILPVGETGRLLVRSQIGATSTRNFDQIPISLRYFAGGDQSVRGFGYQTLGPREVDIYGNWINVGAPYMAVGSLELEKTLYKQFSGAVFVDTGNAMNQWATRLYTGVGVGIRYATPLGPLRIDVARALVPGKIKPRIHISFGMDL